MAASALGAAFLDINLRLTLACGMLMGMTDTAKQGRCGLLEAPDPRDDQNFLPVAELLRDVDLDRVLAGEHAAVVAYIQAWRSTRSRLLAQVFHDCPDAKLPPLTQEALDWQALQAPFSAWRLVATATDEALTLDLIARLRNMLVHSARPLLPLDSLLAKAAGQDFDVPATRRFYQQAVAALEGRGTLAAQIVDVLGLSKAELGRLFGVSRQAADLWLSNDLPGERRAKAATILSITDLLSHRLKPGRLSAIARRPASAYGGLTMLDMIAADRHEELLDSVRKSFDFSSAA